MNKLEQLKGYLEDQGEEPLIELKVEWLKELVVEIEAGQTYAMRWCRIDDPELFVCTHLTPAILIERLCSSIEPIVVHDVWEDGTPIVKGFYSK